MIIMVDGITIALLCEESRSFLFGYIHDVCMYVVLGSSLVACYLLVYIS